MGKIEDLKRWYTEALMPSISPSFRHMEVEIDPQVKALMQEAAPGYPKRLAVQGNPSPQNRSREISDAENQADYDRYIRPFTKK